MLHRLSGSGFHGILSKNMQAMRSTLQNLDDVFKNIPLDSAKKFADFVKTLPNDKLKDALKQQLIQTLKKSYKELLKNDELYEQVLKQFRLSHNLKTTSIFFNYINWIIIMHTNLHFYTEQLNS